MDHSVSITDSTVRASPIGRWASRIALLSLMIVHGVLTLQLFGPADCWRQLLNDDPVTSGRHALHMQQGALGAAAIRSTGTDCTYDPSAYAGYPRTPVFDAESRPAEWFQLLVRRRFGAAAYKAGMAICYWLMPFILWAAAVVRPTCRWCAVLTAGLAVLAAWSGAALDLIESGDWCLPFMATIAVFGLALFARWNDRPCALCWCGLALVTTLGWFVQPAFCLAGIVIGLFAWTILGRIHGWRWHVATGLAQVAALALSYPAWGNWLRDWWVRLPVGHATPAVSAKAFLGIVLWLAVLPTSRLLTIVVAWLAVRPFAILTVGGGLCLAVAGISTRQPATWDQLVWGPRPLSIGLNHDARGLEERIRALTTPDARILWEDLPGRTDLGWTVLLPARIGRPFVGGLDPDGALEHAACALRGGMLGGRPIVFWSDSELDGYARRYNVGWIVCASVAARDRLTLWSGAEPLATDDSSGNWRVYVLRRPHSFVLKGQARNFDTDARRVTISDVIPENGEVILSLHFQDGWRARPASVRIERELDPFDPIPFVRLRMAEPIGRVTLTWDGR
jgi:hypothetical protein